MILLAAAAGVAVDAALDEAGDDNDGDSDRGGEQQPDEPRLRHVDALALELRHEAVGVEEGVLGVEESAA